MTSLLDVLESLVRDPLAKADYASDPGTFLHRQGFGDLAPEDISEALAHAANSFPPVLAAHINPFEGLQSIASVVLDQLGMSDVDDFSVVPAELQALRAPDDEMPDAQMPDAQMPDAQAPDDIPGETALDTAASFGQDTDALDAPEIGASESAPLNEPGSSPQTIDQPDLGQPAQLPTEPESAFDGADTSLDSFDLLGDPDADVFGSDLAGEGQTDGWDPTDTLADLDPAAGIDDPADFDDLDG